MLPFTNAAMYWRNMQQHDKLLPELHLLAVAKIGSKFSNIASIVNGAINQSKFGVLSTVNLTG